MNTTNQVRQILMNELGLTRESIREMVREIVVETVERHIAHLTQQSEMERIIRNRVEQVIKGNQWETAPLKGLITAVAQAEARKYVIDNIEFKWKQP